MYRPPFVGPIAVVALLAFSGCATFDAMFRPGLEQQKKQEKQARQDAWRRDMQSRADDLLQRIEAAPAEKYEGLKSETEAYIAELEAGIPKWDAYTLSDVPGLLRKRLEVLEAKQRLAGWRELSVVSRLGMAPEDSARLDKVQQAFSQTPREMLVTIAEEYTRYQPTSKHEPKHSFHLTPGSADEYRVEWRSDTWVSIALPQRSRPLPVGKAALVWDTDGTRATLVTPSGGRYHTGNLGAVAKLGAPPATDFSAEGEHHYLALSDIELLEQTQELPRGSLAKLSAAIERTEGCAARIWNAANPKLRALKVANLHPTTRANRISAVKATVRKTIRKSCDQHLAKTESVYRQLMATWKSKRASVLSASQDRFSSR